MKRIVGLIIFFGLVFSLFLYFYLRPVSYTSTYTLNDFQITETYDHKNKEYTLKIKSKDFEFPYKTKDKYSHKRNLIAGIEYEQDDGSFCIYPESDYLSLYPLCIKDDTLYAISLKNKNDNSNVIETYNDFNVYDFNDKTYLLWNYHNIIYLNEEDETTYELFNNDIYSLKLAYATDRYLFIPNQTDEFSYQDVLVIDAKKNKMKNYKLNKTLYFDGYILGYKKNNLYLVDRKNTEEYEFNLAKGKLKRINGKILVDNKWENISLTKLIHNTYEFSNNAFINYVLEDNTLYALVDNIKIKITDDKVSAIVKSNVEEVYYIVGDTLYYNNLNEGSKRIITYNEWNFNYNNMIYIF